MTEREALKLALEALEKYAHDFGSSDLSVKAMYVVRQALANVATNDTSQERVDKTSEIVHEAQRTWVGLTWEEIDECFKITPDQYLPAQIYKRIEAKLKEKNNG